MKRFLTFITRPIPLVAAILIVSVATAFAALSIREDRDIFGNWRFYNDLDAQGTLKINGTAVTSTAAEINIMDGVTSTYSELNILDGVTADSGELNTLDLSSKYTFLDDFDHYNVSYFYPSVTPYLLVNGSNSPAARPAVTKLSGGAIALVSGSGAGVDADDISTVVSRNPLTVNKGGVEVETRLKVSNSGGVRIFFGLTDNSAGTEMPASIEATTVTTTLSNGIGFLYDTSATTDQWYAVAVKSDTDATGQAATGTAAATTYQVLKIALADSSGAAATFYINGTQVGATTANTSSATANLFPIISVEGHGASRTVTVDYLKVSHNR